jgi:glycosyltransferase involved in cell wall biosynthesis
VSNADLLEMPIGSEPTVSVVICAYTEDRWDDVLAAVRSVQEQSLAARETILVVDHNRRLFERLSGELQGVRVVENQQERGLSGGKNTGVALSRGSVIAFLDDDAVAEPDWLKFMVDAYTGPDIVGVGGMTLPRWETGRPRWFPEEFDWVVGCTYVGREPGPVRNLLGGNASFRREVFDVGGFPTGIGRTALDSRPLGGEETEFCIRVTQQLPGSVFLYEPRSVIHHWAPVARERFSYFRSRCYAEGLSKALVAGSVGAADALSAEREYTRSALRRGVARGVRQGLRGDRSGWQRAGAIVVGLGAAAWGYGVGRLRMRLPRRPATAVAA